MDRPSLTTLTEAPTWQRLLDRTGVFASIGCAVHCMVAPLLLLAAPALGGLWVHPVVHLAIAGLVLPVAVLALRHGHRSHGKAWIAAAGAVGAALVLVGAGWPLVFVGAAAHAAEGSFAAASCNGCCPSVAVDAATGAWSLRVPPASVITLLGGIALVAAHLGNLRAAACCRS